MGAGDSTMRRAKGVTYNNDTGDVVSCLFCRIVAQQEVNQLWYRDEHVAVFVPRTPAALIHLLVVPIQHVGTMDHLAPEHEPLLTRMRDVALEQLAIHGPRTIAPLGERAPPPSYSFNRGHLTDPFAMVVADPFGPEQRIKPTHSSSPGASATMTSASFDKGGSPKSRPELQNTFDPSQARLSFHRPPWNSIDHLHLHAHYGPFSSCWDRVTFLPGAPWHASLEEAMAKVARLPPGMQRVRH